MMYKSYGNPYMNYNPYVPQDNVYNSLSGKQEIVKVNGEGGARAYQMPPNSSALLLDEMEPLVWLKTTDGAGYPNLTAYQISPRQEQKQPDIRSLEERIARLEGMIKNESYTCNVESSSDEQPIIPDITNKKYDGRKKS